MLSRVTVISSPPLPSLHPPSLHQKKTTSVISKKMSRDGIFPITVFINSKKLQKQHQITNITDFITATRISVPACSNHSTVFVRCRPPMLTRPSSCDRAASSTCRTAPLFQTLPRHPPFCAFFPLSSSIFPSAGPRSSARLPQSPCGCEYVLSV